MPVVVGALAASPEIYALGMGVSLDDIGTGVAEGDPESDPADDGESRRLPGGRDHRRRAARARWRTEGAAGADLDAGLRCLPLSHRDDLRDQRSRNRCAQHGHLSRRAQGDRSFGRAHGLASRRRRRLCALAEISEARQADAGRDRHRLCAGDLLHRAAEARDRFRRDGRCRRADRRADQDRALHHQRSRSARQFRDRHRRPDRSRPAGARRPVRRIARPCRARRLQHVDAGDRDHDEEVAGLRLDHQPGDAVGIERHQEGRLRAALPRASA